MFLQKSLAVSVKTGVCSSGKRAGEGDRRCYRAAEERHTRHRREADPLGRASHQRYTRPSNSNERIGRCGRSGPISAAPLATFAAG